MRAVALALALGSFWPQAEARACSCTGQPMGVSPPDGATEVALDRVIVVHGGAEAMDVRLFAAGVEVPARVRRWSRGDYLVTVVDPITDLAPDTQYGVAVAGGGPRLIRSFFRTGTRRSATAAGAPVVTSVQPRRWRDPGGCPETSCGGRIDHDALRIAYELPVGMVAAVARIDGGGAVIEVPVVEPAPGLTSGELRVGTGPCEPMAVLVREDARYCVRLLGIEATGAEVEGAETCSASETCELAGDDGYCRETPECRPVGACAAVPGEAAGAGAFWAVALTLVGALRWRAWTHRR